MIVHTRVIAPPGKQCTDPGMHRNISRAPHRGGKGHRQPIQTATPGAESRTFAQMMPLPAPPPKWTFALITCDRAHRISLPVCVTRTGSVVHLDTGRGWAVLAPGGGEPLSSRGRWLLPVGLRPTHRQRRVLLAFREDAGIVVVIGLGNVERVLSGILEEALAVVAHGR